MPNPASDSTTVPCVSYRITSSPRSTATPCSGRPGILMAEGRAGDGEGSVGVGVVPDGDEDGDDATVVAGPGLVGMGVRTADPEHAASRSTMASGAGGMRMSAWKHRRASLARNSCYRYFTISANSS